MLWPSFRLHVSVLRSPGASKSFGVSDTVNDAPLCTGTQKSSWLIETTRFEYSDRTSHPFKRTGTLGRFESIRLYSNVLFRAVRVL